MTKKLYTKADLAKKTKKELEDMLEAHGLEIEPGEDFTIGDLGEALLDLTEDDALPDDDDEEVEEDEEELELPDEDEEDDVEDEPAPKKSAKKPAAAKKPKVDANGEDTLAAKQVATILGTEAKVLRQFLRSDASTFEAVGSGGRYEFTEADVPNIKKEFDAWKSAHAARGSKRTGTKGKSSTPAEEVAEVEEIEELDEELDDEIEEDDLELEDED